MKIRWIASVSTTALHIVDVINQKLPLTDPRLNEAFDVPACELKKVLEHCGISTVRLWTQLLALAHQIENKGELATTAIRKAETWQPSYVGLANRLAYCIATCENALRSSIPGILDELENRSRPIREQWDAHGPGLLRCVQQRTDSRILVEAAEVVLVLPVLGGGGAANLSNNTVRFEAVLTNNIPELPEVLRLAWLLAQLHYDLPAFSESVSGDRLLTIAQLSMLPPLLAAAEDLELCKVNPHAFDLTLRNWVFPSGKSQTVSLQESKAVSAQAQTVSTSSIQSQTVLGYELETVSDVLQAWWRAYLESRPSWTTALVALDRMLPQCPVPVTTPHASGG